jgi:hypothetical protein
MRPTGRPGPDNGLPGLASELGLGLEELARTLDRATLNMSILSLDSALEAAANTNTPTAALESTQALAGRLTKQMSELEAAISEVVRGTQP